MDKLPLRISTALLVVLIVCGLAWLAGYDFDYRGFNTFFLALVAVFLGGWTFFFPWS